LCLPLHTFTSTFLSLPEISPPTPTTTHRRSERLKKVRNMIDLPIEKGEIHDSDRKFKCDLCLREYYNRGQYKTHTELHCRKNKKLFRCCGLQFICKSHLQQHKCNFFFHNILSKL